MINQAINKKYILHLLEFKTCISMNKSLLQIYVLQIYVLQMEQK